jgi:hypothetical protein
VWISITGAPTSAAGLDLLHVGADEQRHADPGRLQFRDDRHQVVVLPHHVEPALGGELLPPLRHDAGGVRPRLQRDVDHLAGCSHLEVQRLGQLRLQPRDIIIADVAAILAQMRRDAVGPGRDRRQGGFDRIRMAAAARIADGRDVIDVDAERRGLADIPSLKHGIRPAGPIHCSNEKIHSFTRSTLPTTSFALSCAMIAFRCFRS